MTVGTGLLVGGAGRTGRGVHRAGRGAWRGHGVMKLLAFSLSAMESGDSVLRLFPERQAALSSGRRDVSAGGRCVHTGSRLIVAVK